MGEKPVCLNPQVDCSDC